MVREELLRKWVLPGNTKQKYQIPLFSPDHPPDSSVPPFRIPTLFFAAGMVLQEPTSAIPTCLTLQPFYPACFPINPSQAPSGTQASYPRPCSASFSQEHLGNSAPLLTPEIFKFSPELWFSRHQILITVQAQTSMLRFPQVPGRVGQGHD